MTAQTPTTLKTYFELGDRPTQAQFANLIDSFVNVVQTTAQSITSDLSIGGALTVSTALNAEQAIIVGSPTGGNKGIGTINATGLYVNGTLITTTSAGGSGTVTTGVSGQVAYYSSNSNTVVGTNNLSTQTTIATASAADSTTRVTNTAQVQSAISSNKQTCKAWVNFNGTDGSINDSFNVTSVTRNGTGDYTVNFTTNMNNANYAVLCTVNGSWTPGAGNGLEAGVYNGVPPTISSVRISTKLPIAPTSPTDAAQMSVLIFGS